MGVLSKKASGFFEDSPVLDEMQSKSNSRGDYAEEPASRDYAGVECPQLSIFQRNDTDSLKPSVATTASQESAIFSDTPANATLMTCPTSTSSDRDDYLCKDTDTVTGVYGSDSIHSAISDCMSDGDDQRTGSPTSRIAELVRQTGGHLLQGHSKNDPGAQPSTLLQVLGEENDIFHSTSDRTYGESLSLTIAAVKSLPQSSPNLLSDRR